LVTVDYDRLQRNMVGQLVRFGVVFVVFIALARLGVSAGITLVVLIAVYLAAGAVDIALRRRSGKSS
jgi:hypothetical protein